MPFVYTCNNTRGGATCCYRGMNASRYGTESSVVLTSLIIGRMRDAVLILLLRRRRKPVCVEFMCMGVEI